jgi:hypothetical protein
MNRAADNARPDSLAALLAVGAAGDRVWEPGELSAVLRHQMAAPLEADVAVLGPGTAERVRALCAAAGGRLETFGDLFHHRAPPLELLVLVKHLAKAARDDPQLLLPKEVAAVLYFAAIAVAETRCGARITRLGEREVRAGVRWALALPWLDPATGALFEGAAGRSAGGRHGSS